jgi:predicted RNA-binding Zn-ribbon protein involved in translation (DUF1610 family)
METTHIDGNGAAGLLQEVFVAEITEAHRICQSCRAERPIGAHLAYQGPGVVLRCPNCGDIAATLVALPDRRVFRLHGTWTFGR